MNYLSLLLFSFIGGFILLSVGFWIIPLFQGDQFLHYVNLISVFSTLAVVLTFLIDLRSREEITKQAAIDKYNLETQKYEFDLQDQFIREYPYLTQLYSEINENSPNIVIPTLSPEQKSQASTKQYIMCRNLFQIIENIIHSREHISPKSSWYTVFLNWSKSKIFQSVWSDSKKYYDIQTQNFIDDLIQKSP